MRVYLTEEFCEKFKNKKRVDVDACYRMEQIGILRVFDAFPGDILLEFLSDEVSHKREIFDIFERLKREREAMQKKFTELIELRREVCQCPLEFSESTQLELWAA